MVNLANKDETYKRFIIVTYDKEDVIKIDNVTIEVVPLYKLLLDKVF